MRAQKHATCINAPQKIHVSYPTLHTQRMPMALYCQEQTEKTGKSAKKRKGFVANISGQKKSHEFLVGFDGAANQT